MTTRLLAIALLIPALFAAACGGNDKKDSQSTAGDRTQGVATVNAPTSNTPELRLGQTPTPLAGTTGAATPISSPTPPSTSTASTSTVTVPFPFENAGQARDSLLGNARFGAEMDSLDKNDPFDPKAYPGIARTYPTLRFVGSSVNATPQTVSVYRNYLRDKDTPSTANPKLIVFTVMDTKGSCAAGVIRGFPNYSDYAMVEIGTAACNASSAVAVLRR